MTRAPRVAANGSGRAPLLARGALATALLLAAPVCVQAENSSLARVSACFTPAETCADRIVAALDGARQSIRVQAYGFTSRPILAALVAAKRRGVDVRVILDKSNDPEQGSRRYTGASFVLHAGIPVWIDEQPAIAHNKVIIVDGRLVIGGSYNFTRAAETRNAENVLFIESPEVAGWYLANWTARQEISREVADRPEG